MIFISGTIVLLLFNPAFGMLYLEPLKIDEIMRLFDDEECIEGTLSAFENQPPLFKVETSIPHDFPVVSKLESKSSLNAIHELAFFNNIIYNYNLIEEHGPAHKKRFVVNLIVGEETFQAEGRSIKKAQQEAARLALNSTLYRHPPKKPANDEPMFKLKKTSVQMLSEFVTKYSDAKVVYHYSQHSKSQPNYHEHFYHTEDHPSICRVTLYINNDQFIGEAVTFGEAKEKAAKMALKNLRNIQGMCLLSEGERGFLAKVLGYYDDESPVSLIHEFVSKTQTDFSFDLIAEEGPAHLKYFTFKCSVGNLETYGEGASKKLAKRDAAEKMVELLTVQTSKNSGSCSILTKKPKSKSPKNIIKSQVKSFNPENEYDDLQVNEKADPVSKLYQIQQKIRGPEPVFTFRPGNGRNSFSAEVVVGDFSFVGSGPNKKAAKKSAAEGILSEMGYSIHDSKNRKSGTSKRQRVNFHKFKRMKSTPIGAGLSLNSKNIHDSVVDDYNYNNPTISKNKKLKPDDATSSKSKPAHKMDKRSKPEGKNEKSAVNPKDQLNKLSQNLGFRFQFSDFPKGNNTGFLTLLSLTTDPAKVCYGVGDSIDSSQERAALSALENIYKTELISITEILRQPKEDRIKENILMENIQILDVEQK